MTLRPLSILQSVQGYLQDQATGSADRPTRLAVVDPAYDPFVNWPDPAPLPRVRFEGEATLSTKTYAVANGYIPMPGDRCLMVPVGSTYQILCKVHSPIDIQGFWQDGTDSGVEFGGGSYVDTDNGLVIAGDATISGDLDVAGVGREIWVVKPSNTSRTVTTSTDDPHLATDLTAGTWYVEFTIIMGGANGDIKTKWTVTGSSNYSLRTAWGPSPLLIDSTTAQEARGRDAVPMRVGVHQYGTDIEYGMASASLYTSAREWGVIQVATTGRVALNWSQHTADVPTPSLIVAGSTLRARRVA